jgi:hypothetical protein
MKKEGWESKPASRKEGKEMCVVHDFSQLEEALRQEAREVLVIGRLADQLRRLARSGDAGQSDALTKNVLGRIQQEYAILLREKSHCVPVVLRQHADKTWTAVNGGPSDC